MRQLHFAQINEAQLTDIAHRLAPAVREGGVIFLRGELGAGKTTFARALLGALGITGRIKSPTYSLIESYAAGDLTAHHLDLYRIADPGELEWLGLSDLAQGHYLLLVEWPERGTGALLPPDLTIHLTHAQKGRDVAADASTSRGEAWLMRLAHPGHN